MKITSENKNIMENIACNLYSMLKCLSTVDSDNAAVLQELPRAVRMASDIAQKLYESIVEIEVETQSGTQDIVVESNF